MFLYDKAHCGHHRRLRDEHQRGEARPARLMSDTCACFPASPAMALSQALWLSAGLISRSYCSACSSARSVASVFARHARRVIATHCSPAHDRPQPPLPPFVTHLCPVAGVLKLRCRRLRLDPAGGACVVAWAVSCMGYVVWLGRVYPFTPEPRSYDKRA
eukprot:6839421-Prymnesium_polylepis.1